LLLALGAASGSLCLLGSRAEGAASTADPKAAAAAVYDQACAACHGADGAGAPPDAVAFDIPLPDFSDCTFATREPDADWLAVAHEGGPARAFHHFMPAFGGALTQEELLLALEHIRSFCPEPAWPRGDLNLPRPLVTSKAFPEDEVVLSTDIDREGQRGVSNKLIYEARLGARHQLEVVLPFAWEENDSRWVSGIGDAAVAYKRVLHHDHSQGRILSATGEVIFPTGDEDDGLSAGFTVFEPFLTYGQILPRNSFLQLQVGAELPLESGHDDEGFARAAFGRTFNPDPFGRSWSPMLEVLAARPLTAGADTEWDLVPQIQVSLSRRQHVLFNVGVRVPLNHTDARDTRILAYILWDWFDGGLFQGWK
jgi:hypothetical protein